MENLFWSLVAEKLTSLVDQFPWIAVVLVIALGVHVWNQDKRIRKLETWKNELSGTESESPELVEGINYITINGRIWMWKPEVNQRNIRDHKISFAEFKRHEDSSARYEPKTDSYHAGFSLDGKRYWCCYREEEGYNVITSLYPHER